MHSFCKFSRSVVSFPSTPHFNFLSGFERLKNELFGRTTPPLGYAPYRVSMTEIANFVVYMTIKLRYAGNP